MKYTIRNKRINAILDEFADEYKNLLVEAVLTQEQDFDIDNINISEIAKIDIEVKERLKNRGKNKKINKISRMIYSLGIVYSLFGLMLIIISEADKGYANNPWSNVAIICVFLGLITAIIGLMTKVILRSKETHIRKRSIVDYEIQIINKWRILEGIIYEIFPKNDKLSLRSMLSSLEQTKIISKEDYKTLNSLMYYRNKILHTPPGKVKCDEITHEEIRSLLNAAQDLIDKLSILI